MTTFLKYVDTKTWKVVLTGWTPPMQAVAERGGRVMISKCSVAKEAWKILQTTYDGTAKVRMSRLQQLTTKWETAKMKDDESITAYNTRINDMANQAFGLGEPMSNEKKVRKVLRSLAKRFESKVTTIEES
ncbi:hypothetical protein LIER_29932 [Lithospermum erythrorhizon]|uniref:Gag-pol polyprotein n=1 Tax=Lithospermum erythrorhizon TaxID=34254 RepID=A0AAV3RME6_LITER